MNMYLILLTYKVSLEEISKLADDHFEHLRKYYSERVFVLGGRRKPRTGGVILAMGGDVKEVESIAKSDPFCSNDLADYEVIEFELGSWLPDLNCIFGEHANE